MKKLIVLIICLAMVFSIEGCGSGGEAQANPPEEKAVDVDLTELSATMVYSEVFNMMTEVDEYVDKTVKMEGLFSVYQDETTGEYHYGCIIQDATACCAQGLEFILAKDRKYPDDFPEEGETISVIGVFDYERDGVYQYVFLKDAEII